MIYYVMGIAQNVWIFCLKRYYSKRAAAAGQREDVGGRIFGRAAERDDGGDDRESATRSWAEKDISVGDYTERRKWFKKQREFEEGEEDGAASSGRRYSLRSRSNSGRAGLSRVVIAPDGGSFR